MSVHGEHAGAARRLRENRMRSILAPRADGGRDGHGHGVALLVRCPTLTDHSHQDPGEGERDALHGRVPGDPLSPVWALQPPRRRARRCAARVGHGLCAAGAGAAALCGAQDRGVPRCSGAAEGRPAGGGVRARRFAHPWAGCRSVHDLTFVPSFSHGAHGVADGGKCRQILVMPWESLPRRVFRGVNFEVFSQDRFNSVRCRAHRWYSSSTLRSSRFSPKTAHCLAERWHSSSAW